MVYQLVELIQTVPTKQLAKAVYLNGEYIGTHVENAIKMLKILNADYQYRVYRRIVTEDAAQFPLLLSRIDPSELVDDYVDT